MENDSVRILDDNAPRSGEENMRIDSDLLDQAASGQADGVVVRVYEWSEPTVTLGYFQSLESDPGERLRNCPRIKRLTGGGAILHDQEFTYSVVTPPDHRARKDPYRLYETVHNALIRLLSASGVESMLRRNADCRVPDSDSEPYLCFLRSDDNDIVCRGKKIVGSAQRRRRGAILQHGSIIVRHSDLTPEISGICDLFPQFEPDSFRKKLAAKIAETLGSN